MKRNIKYKLINGAVVVLISILVPTIFTLICGGIWGRKGAKKEPENVKIIMKYNGGDIVLSLEDFLIYCMADELEISTNSEYLKMRAVMYRTEILRKMGSETQMQADKLDVKYVTESTLRQLWQNEYDNNISYIRSAIESTEKQVIRCDEKLIIPYCHRMSAGNTRLGENPPDYIKSVTVESDTKEQGYTCLVSFSNDELSEKFGSSDISILNQCSLGYVIKIKAGNNVMSGEDFAEKLSLPSNNFEISKKEDGVEIVTKGIGNGVGVSLNGAKVMAENGSDYKEILNFFYKNIQISVE